MPRLSALPEPLPALTTEDALPVQPSGGAGTLSVLIGVVGSRGSARRRGSPDVRTFAPDSRTGKPERSSPPRRQGTRSGPPPEPRPTARQESGDGCP
ncbi:MAG: hypothetical protein QMD46_11010 [Methanomicrobiales archaeon]|nr:hypothetical protein [Methanomicrobiales archaeon]